LLALACAQPGSPLPPQSSFATTWRSYQALPPHRALAVAGSLRSERWVSGAAGGHATRADAESAALRECRRRRHEQRMQDPCLLHPEGDERGDPPL
jgi:hypothetical protein